MSRHPFAAPSFTAAISPPPTGIAALHVNLDDDEARYVLDGTLGFGIGDETLTADAGSAVPLTFRRERGARRGAGPDRGEAQTAALARELHAGTGEDLHDLFMRHAPELL